LKQKEKKNNKIEKKIFQRKQKFLNCEHRLYFSGTLKDKPLGMPKINAVGYSAVKNLVIVDTAKGIELLDHENKFIACLCARKDTKCIYGRRTHLALKAILQNLKLNKTKRSDEKQPRTDDGDAAYACVGPKPNRGGRGIIDNTFNLNSSPQTQDEIFRIMSQVQFLVQAYVDPNFVKAHTEMMDELMVPGFKKSSENEQTSVLTNIALGMNVYLPQHKDQDAFLSATMVFDTNKSDDDILAYFCFAGLGFAVAMHHGDVLIFDPLEPHCISSRAVGRDIYCMSFYCKSALVGGNDNEREVTEAVLNKL